MLPLIQAGLAAGMAGYKYFKGRRALSKPTPFQPRWDSPENIALRNQYKMALKTQAEALKGTAAEDVRQYSAGAGISGSPLETKFYAGQMEKIGQEQLKQQSIFEQEQYAKFTENKQAWEAMETARGKAQDQLTQDLLGDVIGAMGGVFSGLGEMEAGKQAVAATKGMDIKQTFQMFKAKHPGIPAWLMDPNKLTSTYKTEWENYMTEMPFDYTKYGQEYGQGGG